MKKKIFFLLLDINIGGAQAHVIDLLSQIDRSKYETCLVTVKKEGGFAGAIPDDIEVFELKSYKKGIFKFIFRVWKDRPDTIVSVLAPYNIALCILRPLLPKCRIILQEVTIVSQKLKGDWNPPRLWRWLYAKYYPKADLIIPPSEAIIDDIHVNLGIPRDKCKKINMSIDVDKIKEQAEVFNPYNGAGRMIVAVGRLIPTKRYAILIKAFSEVVKDIPDVRLTIVGDGPEKNDLEKQAVSLGVSNSIDFTGFKDNPYPYFYYADLFVHTSAYEGFGKVIIEAMTCGVPVVAVKGIGAVEEVMRITGNSKYYVPEGLLRGTISGMLTDSSEKDRIRGLDLSDFSLKNVMAEYEKYL